MDYFSADLEKIKNAIDNKKIFHSVVTKIGEDDEQKKGYMTVQVSDENGLNGGYVGWIYIDESDDDVQRRSLLPLLGERIPFVILSIDEESHRMVCSRKIAQQIIKENMKKDIGSGKVFHAKITRFVDYGAFLDVNGVSGILRTTDFSTDHSEIPEYYKIGDTIPVVCRDISSNGRMFFRAQHMHQRTEPLRVDIREKQIVLGTVRSIRTFETGPVYFVHIETGLDCLCPVPDDMEIEYGVDVAVIITSVRENEDPLLSPHIRGRIIRVY